MPHKRKRPSLDSQISIQEPLPSPKKNIKTRKIQKQKQEKKKEQPKLPALTKKQRVPTPPVDVWAPSALVSTDKSRKKRYNDTIRSIERRVSNFIKFADQFKVNFTLDELERRDVGRNDASFDAECEALLGPNTPSRTISAKYYAKDGEPLFFYLGDRYEDEPPCDGSFLDIEHQYDNSTPADFDRHVSKGLKVLSDGITGDMLNRYHLATQKLCSRLHPVTDGSDKRHAFHSGDDNPRILRYKRDLSNEKTSPEEVEERKGVVHIVQGWIQQAQPTKGLFLSSEFSRSGRGLSAIRCWFRATEIVSMALKRMFMGLFPEVYAEFQAAFDAGQWISEDPGPWLGRVIVYKLQVDAHRDQRDMNPTASFPCGSYTGGEMQIPQLPTKFTYKPGHVCIFRSAQMYHRVARWEATEHTDRYSATPGRIGSVSFFPEESFQVLKDKVAGWGRDTAYGDWDDFYEFP